MRIVAILLLLAVGAVFALMQGGDDTLRPDVVPVEDGAQSGRVDLANGTSLCPERTEAEREATGNLSEPAVKAGMALVRGRLVQRGEPRVGIEIHTLDQRSKSSDDGSFFINLPVGKHWLAMNGDGVPFRYSFGPVFVHEGQRRVDLGDVEVPAPVTITGRVVDEREQPVEGVRVYASNGAFHRELGPDDPGADRNTVTDGNGRFAISGMVPGRVNARAERIGFRSQSADVVIAEGEGDVGLLVLRAAETLRGFVVDEHGAAIADALVMEGGGRSDPRRRFGVRTRADGGFDLPGYGRRWNLTVEREGYAHTVLDRVHKMPRPIRVEMKPAQPFDARVLGLNGSSAEFYVQLPAGDWRSTPEWMSAYMYGGTPVEADGTIHIDHLPAGKWRVFVMVDGIGTVPPTEFEIPLAAPLELSVAASSPIEVVIVDDAGAPVPDAEVTRVELDKVPTYGKARARQLARRWFGWPANRRETYRADENGHVTVMLPEGRDLHVAARTPAHLPNMMSSARDALPDVVTIELVRGGTIRGTVANAELSRHVGMMAFAAANKVDRSGAMTIDRSGVFVSPPLAPGTYGINVQIVDRTHFSDDKQPLAEPVPLICNYGARTKKREVVVRAGAETVVELDVPPTIELRGRVIVAGKPVAGAIVFGRMAEQEYSTVDRLNAQDFNANCRTDAQGNFRFLVAAAGKLELRARRETSATFCKPVVIDIDLASGDRSQDVHLPASAIRGSYDMSTIAPQDRRYFTAQLYPIEKGAHDPFYSHYHGIPEQFLVQSLPLGEVGTFSFDALQPGVWVVRLVTRREVIVWQREITIVSDEVVDLGRMVAEPRVQPQLRSGLPRGFGVTVCRASDTNEAGLFEMSVDVFSGDKLLPPLAPGRYRLHVSTRDLESDVDANGRKLRTEAQFELHADGTTTPSKVWPDGL